MFSQSIPEKLPQPERIDINKSMGKVKKLFNDSENDNETDSESDYDPGIKNDPEYIASKEEVTNAIGQAFTTNSNLNIKLLNYTRHKIFSYTGKESLKEISTEDIIYEAIKRILQGKRKWKMNKFPNIVHFILMVTFSIIKNELKKIEYEDNPLYNEIEAGLNTDKKKKSRPRIIPLTVADREGNEYEDTIPDRETAQNFDKELFGLETETFEELIAKVESLFEEDNDIIAFCVFQERLENNKSNKEIADKLGIDVREVENALKRIKRKTCKVLN